MSNHPLGWLMKSIIDRLKDERLTDEKYHFPKRTPASPRPAQLLFLSWSSPHLSCCCLRFDVSHSRFMFNPSAHTSRSVFTIYLSLRPSSSPSLVLLWNHLSSESITDWSFCFHSWSPFLTEEATSQQNQDLFSEHTTNYLFEIVQWFSITPGMKQICI